MTVWVVETGDAAGEGRIVEIAASYAAARRVAVCREHLLRGRLPHLAAQRSAAVIRFDQRHQ